MISKNENVMLFHSNEEERIKFSNTVKYWSNACGELYRNNNEEISVSELPLPLQRAYNDLWSENYGSHCYLVETPTGYGVALVSEYDLFFCETHKFSMEDLFETACQDAIEISKHIAFKKADIYVGEFMGFNECHNLIVVFPADMPIEEFKNSAEVLDEFIYKTAKTICELGPVAK